MLVNACRVHTWRAHIWCIIEVSGVQDSAKHTVSDGGQIKLKDDVDEKEVSAIVDRAKLTKFKTLFVDLPEDVAQPDLNTCMTQVQHPWCTSILRTTISIF